MATNRNNVGQITRKKWFFESLSEKVINSIAEANLEPYQTFKMVLFTKKANGFQPLAISTKSFILDV